MKIVLSKDIKDIDAQTVEEQGITSYELMHRAANALTGEILKQYSGGRFHIFAGPGNNGGDAILTGLNLCNAGHDVTIYLFNTTGRLSDNCQKARDEAATTTGLNFIEVTKTFETPHIDDGDTIIDGLFGTGINKPLSKGFAAMAVFINNCHARTISIDIPSGLMCEDNSFNNMQSIIKADLTLAIQFPKLAMMFQEFGQYTGEVRTIDIGLSAKAIAGCQSPYCTIERAMVAPLIKKRKRQTHKGDYGHALLVAGSYGMCGAAVLAARGCLRSGIGLLKVQVPASCVEILQATVPEAVVCPDYHEHIFTSANCDITEPDAIGIGPGLRQDPLTAEGLRDILTRAHVPMVIDADALNMMADGKQLMRNIPAGSILTPHLGEFDRLTGKSKDPYTRLAKAIETASNFGVYIILKSSFTSVITPQGEVFINTIGNPGMATGGSGDVLTGILTALIAQGYTGRDAALLGTYVHSLAGDMAAAKAGQISMTAGDIAGCLPQAWMSLAGDGDNAG